MQNLTSEDHQRLQAELSADEQILWSGKPNPSVIFHSNDWGIFIFSIFWVAFTAFWEATALGYPHSLDDVKISFFDLWGIPFILVGQYMLWGRFVYTAWKKKQILYAVTSQRAMSLLSPRSGKVVAAFIDTLPALDKRVRPDGIGTIVFGQFPSTRAGSGYGTNNNADSLYLFAGIPVFVDIDDAQTVYTLITNLRARANRPS